MRAHTNNSFSYKSIHPTIRNILDERSTLDNTVQLSMPFIKATTTLNLSEILGDGIGFTLGIHATEIDLQYQDIYAPQDGRYLVGYTYQSPPPGQDTHRNRLIYADSSIEIQDALRIFDLNSDISNTTEFSAVPPPGITRVSIGKRRSGLISVANISFSVPTLIQLEFLHKVFLIPGIGMILEWGHQFAPKKSDFVSGETGLIDNINDYMFPWYGQNAYGETREELFERLARNQISVQEILEKYSYPTRGQYQWMFGRVASFNVNSNSDGSYECTVRITGPSEDSWAYSVRNTSIPAITRGSDSVVCINKTNSVVEYFTKDAGIDSFKGVLEATIDSSRGDGIPRLSRWRHFVRKFEKPPADGFFRSLFASSQQAAKDIEDAYFISWRYFVNVILNDEEYGIKSIFKNINESPDWLDKISLLRSYTNSQGEETAPVVNGEVLSNANFIDPYENFVGSNSYLRSTDLSIMIIVNERAAELADEDEQRRLSTGDQSTFLNTDDMTVAIKNMGDFHTSAQNVNDSVASSDDIPLFEQIRRSRGGSLENISRSELSEIESTIRNQRIDENDRGFLSTGVWINHKAIIQAFSTANTILDGIQNLLTRMSSATNGYWNLVIDISEPVYIETNPTGLDFHSYSVVDLNYVENSEYAVREFLNPTSENRVHTFNKYIRDLNGQDVGSELTDCKINISLPATMFSQIATLGIVQPEDNPEDTPEELRSTEPPIVADVHDTIRKMFSITSIARRPDGTSADLTSLVIERPESGNCSGQTTARGPAGTTSSGISDRSILSLNTQDEITARRQSTTTRIAELDDFIRECEEKCEQSVEEVLTEESPREEPAVLTIADLPDNRTVSQLTIGEILDRQPLPERGFMPRYLFAVGKYQVIPVTLKEAVERIEELSTGDIFSREVQEIIGDYLLLEKPGRGALSRYLIGTSDNINAAHLDLANEFEALAGPSSDPNSNLGVAGNRTNTTSGQIRSLLEGTRSLRGRPDQLTALKNLIASREGGPDGYDAANVVPVRNGAPRPLRVGDPNYKRAINSLPWVNARELSDPVPDFADQGITPSTRPRTSTTSVRFTASNECPQISRRQRSRQRQPGSNLGLGIGSIPRGVDTEEISVVSCEGAVNAREDLNEILRQLSIREQEIPRLNTLAEVRRDLPHLRAVYRYLEPFPDYMVANIRKTADGNSSNAFGAAPGAVSIKAELEMPGISGLRLGQLFWVDRMPAFYKAYGAFIILGVEEEITTSGWKTKFDGTFYYLGNAWKSAVAKILRGEIILQ